MLRYMGVGKAQHLTANSVWFMQLCNRLKKKLPELVVKRIE
jgi:hypothetical protein